MKTKRIGVMLAAMGVGAMALTGCSVKQVDKAVTGATQVPGTGNLWRFCDGTTLIYYSDYGSASNDDYEFVIYDGCSVDPNATPRVAGE